MVFSKIIIPVNGYVVAQARDQETLGNILDERCVTVLDKNQHYQRRVTTKISDNDYF
jgi:hypothetical protein